MLLSSLLITFALATPDRLSTIQKDLSRSERIYLSAGLATVLEFPKAITEVRVGNPSVVKIEISNVSPKELSLFLKSYDLGPTNLLVRIEKRIYVFDILPSRSTHQDYIRISGGYGSPSQHTSLTLKEYLPLKFEAENQRKGVEVENIKLE